MDSRLKILLVDDNPTILKLIARSLGKSGEFITARDGTVDTLVSGPPFDFPHDLVRLDDGSFVVTDGYAAALFRVSATGEVSVLTEITRSTE